MSVLCDHNHSFISIHINKYLQYLTALKYSPKSISSYKHALNRFLVFLTAGNTVGNTAKGLIQRIADITSKDLDTYRLELIDKKYSGHTISLYLRSVRKLFNYLEETRQVFINPARSMVIPAITAEIKPVPTEADINNLLIQPDISTFTGIRDRAIIETFYSTGIRLFELISMNIHDMDLNQGRVKVTGKGNKQRVVPMGRHAVIWTDKYLSHVKSRFFKKRPDEHALWLGVMGRRIHPLTIERFVFDYSRKAGIRHPVTPHALRRACATHMLRCGAHPVQIQMLLGHASLQVLSRYLKVTITDLIKTHRQGKPGK